ncbi:MAG: hypothetical protein ACLGH4_06930 [Actinomycetes bacterium]
MTVHTAHPSLHVSPTSAGLGMAGLLVAVAAGFAVVSAISDPAVLGTPDPVVSQVEPPSGARDSWEGRIGPGAGVGGVRDSWMPPGATDQELEKSGKRK